MIVKYADESTRSKTSLNSIVASRALSNERRQDTRYAVRKHGHEISHRTGVLLAKVAFLLIMIAGVWFAAAGALSPEALQQGDGRRRPPRRRRGSLIVATHLGEFGNPDR